MPPLSEDIVARSSAAFRAAAGLELLACLDQERGVVYAVDDDLVLQFVNRAWSTFALANDGQRCVEMYGLGRSTRSAIPEILLPFYQASFEAVSSGTTWEHIYECSSPNQTRSFRMRAWRLSKGGYIVVSNDPIDPADTPADSVNVAGYMNRDGVIVQCAHCRRCRNIETETWEWVPLHLLAPLSRVSHGICSPCLAYHYPR